MRYEQYGAPMGYQPMGTHGVEDSDRIEKQQGAYMNRNVPGMFSKRLFHRQYQDMEICLWEVYYIESVAYSL